MDLVWYALALGRRCARSLTALGRDLTGVSGTADPGYCTRAPGEVHPTRIPDLGQTHSMDTLEALAHTGAFNTLFLGRPEIADSWVWPAQTSKFNDFRLAQKPCTLCYAIVLPGHKSAFWARFWPDCYRESTKIGPPAGRGPAGEPNSVIYWKQSGPNPARRADLQPDCFQ